jgi:acetyl/propionyl-CoA carboxylase alpha subunit
LRRREGSALQAIALYTGVDRDAPFVRHADEAVRLEERTSPTAAYLDHDALLRALREARADAVWPGWGFVSEDPAFVDRVVAAGVHFLGPAAETMRALGDKIAAKHLAEQAGVPVTAWSRGAVADEAEARRHAERIGYPVMIKAAAGGGGRGIRAVDAPEKLDEAFRSAASEALAAFGDASRCRSPATPTVTCSHSAVGTAPCSAGIRR